MLEFWNNHFETSSFIPHGHCYLWKPELVGLHLTSDLMIAIAYYSIPITLFYFVRNRPDLPFNRIFLLFCLFIVACGTTHLMNVWTLWHPVYWVSGILKAITATVSVFTAIQLIPIVPQALALPSPEQLVQANQALQEQIAERLKIEAELKTYQGQLEQRVADRTAQLADSNRQMEDLLRREQEARRQAEAAKVEIQKREETARRQLAEIEAIYATAPIGLCVLDTEFRYVRINEYLAEINGLAVADHLGHTVRELLPELGEVQEQIFQQVLVSGNPILNVEVHGTTPAQPGVERDWLVSYYPLRSQDEEVLGINVTAQEITDRKLAEQALQDRATELARLNARLAQTTSTLQERNQDLDQFAYIVSHDLKAPLRAISSLSEWIEEDLSGHIPAENQQQLGLLRSRVRRMEALIDGLLTYSRVGRTEVAVEPVDVNELLAEVIDSLSPPPSFTIIIPSDLPRLNTKRLLLNQVFSNLISNAIKHHTRPDGRVVIAWQDTGDFHEFAVSDDGPGIEPQYYDKIFTIFQTLKTGDRQDNTGVGLSIVKKILDTEGGRIQVESHLNLGTTFRFWWRK